MANRNKQVLKHQAQVLEEGEQLLATLLTLPHGGVKQVGIAGGVAGQLGAAGASAGIQAGVARAIDKAQVDGDSMAARFPVGLLLISVTDQRVLVFERPSVQSVKPERLVAEFPKDWLARSSSTKAFLKSNLTLEFNDGSTLQLDSGAFQGIGRFHDAVARPPDG